MAGNQAEPEYRIKQKEDSSKYNYSFAAPDDCRRRHRCHCREEGGGNRRVQRSFKRWDQKISPDTKLIGDEDSGRFSRRNTMLLLNKYKNRESSKEDSQRIK